MNEKLFTTEDFARLLHVSPRTVLRERLAGKLSYKRIRGRIRFTQEDLDLYLQRQSNLTAGSLQKAVGNTGKVRIFSRRK